MRIAGTTAPGTMVADEVARIGRVHGDAFAGARELLHVCELFGRGRQRELLAAEAADEATALHEPAVFEPA